MQNDLTDELNQGKARKKVEEIAREKRIAAAVEAKIAQELARQVLILRFSYSSFIPVSPIRL